MRQLMIWICVLVFSPMIFAADIPSSVGFKNALTAQTESLQKIQQTVADLQLQVQRVTADFNDFKLQANVRLDALAANNSAVQARMAAIVQGLDATIQKVNILQKVQHKNEQGLVKRWENKLEQIDLIRTSFLVLGIVVLLLLLWLLFRVVNRRKSVSDAEGIPADEYDLMNSTEGIPAKLNLARAYIEMNNKDLARTLLHQVLKQGDDAQKREAQTLLESCA